MSSILPAAAWAFSSMATIRRTRARSARRTAIALPMAPAPRIATVVMLPYFRGRVCFPQVSTGGGQVSGPETCPLAVETCGKQTRPPPEVPVYKALVTGGTRGIGRAIAAAILAEGGHVVITGRSARGAESAARELGATAAEPSRVSGIELDVRDRQAVDRAGAGA